MNNKEIFVVGNSRSGTTMMGRILGAHESVFTFHELHFFEQLWSPHEATIQIKQKDARNLFAKLICLERDGYLSGCLEYEQYLQESGKEIFDSLTKSSIFVKFLHYEANLHNKSIACDQTPRNLFYCKEIIELYPDAKIIYMVRDPRDVLLSQKYKWKRHFLGAKSIPGREALRSLLNYHPITICKLWKASVNSMKPFEDNNSVKQVYFEDLLQQPEKTIKEICEFLNIQFSNKMLNIPQVGSSIDEDKPDRIGIDQNKIAGYRKGGLTNTELNICESILKESMFYHDYKPDGVKGNFLGIAWNYFTFPIKVALALVINLNRMKNIAETIKRRTR